MGCNCNKNKPKRRVYRPEGGGKTDEQSFVLVKRDGSRETFGSRLEANAANVRSGYTGRVVTG